MPNLRVAVIGVGPRGLNHLAAIDAFDDVTLAAVCDPADESRRAAATRYAPEGSYAAVDEMLDAETLDAVIVAVPPHLNAVAALPCLRRGVSTMLEKPPGLSTAETEELRDAAAATGALGMVAWNRRFHPMVAAAREIVESRGPIVQIVAAFHKSLVQVGARRQYSPDVMDNMLYESPIHAIDLVRALAASEVTQVHSVVRRDSPDTRTCTLRSSSSKADASPRSRPTTPPAPGWRGTRFTVEMSPRTWREYSGGTLSRTVAESKSKTPARTALWSRPGTSSTQSRADGP